MQVVSKFMEKDMPLRLCFHDNGYIYIKGNHHNDTFEVIIAQIDLNNFDDDGIESRSKMMDVEGHDQGGSMDEEGESEMKSYRMWNKKGED
jgi:hypothetical protein